MERAFSADFSAVRIHEGSEAAAMGAEAYTRGSDIFFAPGKYDPTSAHGKELLGHELTHVVQQSQGRVQATAQAKGMAINADASLEHEADAMGAQAARGEPVGGAVGGSAPAANAHAPAQMRFEAPVIQRKGDKPLRAQVPVDGSDASAPKDQRIDQLITDMAAYDSSTDGRPAQQLKHNTSAYDDIGLGNSGFLFFFIESRDAPMRATRFAAGDEGATSARISIPITESGLLERGWIMLSDFAQREYPDIATNEAGDKHASWLPTRADEQQKKKGNEEMTQPVRHFTAGPGHIEMEDFEEFQKLPTSEHRQAASAVTPQVRGDKDSKQTYTGSGGTHEVPDRMLNNMLVGADIIPGLAMRAALEVSRIAKVNPTLATTLKTLDGAALMSFMLKDLFRPQAMIPNTVAIKPEHVQRS